VGTNGRQAESGSVKNESQILKNENLTLKNENRATHVVVKDHDSNQDDLKQQHEHDRAILKNESDFDTLQALAEHGMRPGDAQAKAGCWRSTAWTCARGSGKSLSGAASWRDGLRTCAAPQVQATRSGCCTPRKRPGSQGDWPLPAEKGEKKAGRWYTEEEYEEFFEH
jgi:hypothetical protein